jgi:DNA-binding CsgD family transcriptional regulator
VLRERLLVTLPKSPRLVLGIAGAQAVIVSFDGLPASPYFASCLIPIGVAILAGGEKLAWEAAAIVDGVLVLSMIGVGATPSFAGGAGTTVGALLAPPAATVALAIIIRAYELTTSWIAKSMADAGVSRVAFASAQVLLSPAYEDYQPDTPWGRLTPSEVRIASALARFGKTAAIGRAEGLANSTVDNELASAMRKTGCRTRSQLAALTAHPGWPEASNGD